MKADLNVGRALIMLLIAVAMFAGLLAFACSEQDAKDPAWFSEVLR
jgi:hypothetical protein